MISDAGTDRKVNIIQGEFYVTTDPSVVITTLLGSCIAACLRDPVAGVGGMNHFLLPGRRGGSDVSERESVHLMELLVNGLLKSGARRDRLEAKIFGGARTVRGLSDIGQQNAEFAERFIRNEGIAFKGGSTGGDQGRRIQFWPLSGRARQIMLAGDVAFEQKPAKIVLPVSSNAGELELF